VDRAPLRSTPPRQLLLAMPQEANSCLLSDCPSSSTSGSLNSSTPVSAVSPMKRSTPTAAISNRCCRPIPHPRCTSVYVTSTDWM
jgi:hypothetical protein